MRTILRVGYAGWSIAPPLGPPPIVVMSNRLLARTHPPASRGVCPSRVLSRTLPQSEDLLAVELFAEPVADVL